MSDTESDTLYGAPTADDDPPDDRVDDHSVEDAPDSHGWFAVLLERWWNRVRHHQNAEERRSVINQLFPELDPDARDSWKAKFVLLMAMSAIIATMGLLDDSPAVVVGAMLVAPLMRPVLAVALAAILGWWHRLGSAVVTVAAATAGMVGAGVVLAAIVPGQSITGEVLARTSPDLTDLAVAFAAGVAGAYATVRSDISGALPGVAVAVALVPPLAAAGIALEAGRSDLATGALLLYAANLVAIATSAAVVFAVSGMVPAPHLHLSLRRTTLVAVASVAAVAAVLVPLGLATYRASITAQRTEVINTEVLTWLDGTDLLVDHLRVDERPGAPDGSTPGATIITVDISGQSPPPDGSTLAGDLAGRLGTTVDVRIRWTQTAPGAPANPEPYNGLVPAATIDDAVAIWLDGQDLEVSDIDVSGTDSLLIVNLSVTGPEAPPPATSLAALLSDRTGGEVDVSVAWTQQRLFSDDDPIDAAETDVDVARRIAQAWAAANDVRVLDVAIVRDGDTRTIEIAITSRTQPSDAADLADELIAALDGDGGVEVAVRWSATRDVPVTTTTRPATPTTTEPA